MNVSLRILAEWAEDRAENDEDVAARPLWGQIAGEVRAYLAGDSEEPPEQEPLFGGSS